MVCFKPRRRFGASISTRTHKLVALNFNPVHRICDESVVLLMNIGYSEVNHIIDAKTCGCKTSGRVTYSFVDTSHALCLDRKDIMIAELEACERLLKYADESDRIILEKEIADLKLALDLMP